MIIKHFVNYPLYFYSFVLALNSRGKLFMGDSGVLLSSFVIAYVVIKFYNKGILIDADTIFILMMVQALICLDYFY